MNKSLLLSLLALFMLGVSAWWLTRRPNEPTLSEADRLIAEAAQVANKSTRDGDAESGDAESGGSKQSSNDPRLTYPTIFRNVKPQVAYMGDSNCAQCHQELCTTFHQHPMGRSASLAGGDKLEELGPEAMNPCQVGPYELRVRIEDGKMTHSLSAKTRDGETLPSVDFPTTIAIGSGTRGRSYLVYDADSVWQSPVSWFTTKKRWDVSPGFDLGTATQRPTITQCLYCHVNHHEVIPDTINRYKLPLSSLQLSIGCERCHGPGELHSKERTDGKPLDSAHPGIDTSIVNPKHLSDDLQLSICAQCHLSGKSRVTRKDRLEHDFRPGLPLELFINAFLTHPEAQFKNKAVGHFDQMLLVKCRTLNGGKLLCTTCHDPHQSYEPQEAQRRYIDDCKSCHQTQVCSETQELRAKQQDNCIKCHMPTNSNTNIAHVSLTDHRILRRPSEPLASNNGPMDQAVLVPYFQSDLLTAAEKDRDLGIALAGFSDKMPPNLPIKKPTLDQARVRLREAVERSPEDTDAWIALSTVEVGSGNPNGAFAAMQSAMRAAPRNEDVLAQFAFVAEIAGKLDLAIGALNDLVAINPSSTDYRLKRMVMQVANGDFYQAQAESQELLRINPLQPTARLIQGMCLYGQGDKTAGRREVDIAMNLASSQQQKAMIQSWFNRFVAFQSKTE
jgi:Flp pilus assembly protein TadD